MKVFVGIVVEQDCLEELSQIVGRLHGLVISDSLPEPYDESAWKRIGTMVSKAFLHHFKKPKLKA